MLSHGDTVICPKLMPISKSKYDLARLKFMVNIEVNGQGHTDVMNVRMYTSYHGKTLTCQKQYDYVKEQKRCGLTPKPCHKPYKFDLEVKGQRRMRNMNLRDKPSHCDTPMCNIY